MRNPFLKSFTHFLYYLTAWIFIGTCQAAVVFYLHPLPMLLLVQNILAADLVFATLLLLIWPIVRFLRFEHLGVHHFRNNHAALVIIFFLLWILLIHGIFEGMPPHLTPRDIFKVLLPFHVFTGICCYAITMLIYYLQISNTSFIQRVEKESALYRSVKDTELQLLKSQLHPHFIFNALNSINALLITSPDSAQDMLIKLSAFLRISLDKTYQSLVTFEEELNYAGIYLDIEKIRFGERLEMNLQVDPEALSAILPHLILQPLYENVVKHGLSGTLGKITLEIVAGMKEGILVIQIKNNIGEVTRKNDPKSIGIKNVQRRLSLFYGRKDCIQIDRTDHFFEVKLLIPQISN